MDKLRGEKMGARELDPRLKELYDSGVPVYSISRLGTINGCLHEAYRTYVLKEKGAQNVYGALGTRIHDTLEAIVNGEATESDLLPAMNAEFEDLDMWGISFPKDAKGGDSIKDGWVKDMVHFCETYKSPRGPHLHTEELFIYKTPKGRYMQGYIDLYAQRPDGSIDIYDYKTSSMYKGADLKEHAYQLLTYALAKQQEGFKVNRVAWIFLKFVDVTFMGKKTVKSKEKTQLTKTIERKKIAQEMAKYVEQDLADAGYDEIDIELIMNEFNSTNKFDCLPEEIRAGYKMKPCVYYYELTDETLRDCINYIDSTIDFWESLNQQSEKEFPPRSFTKTQKNGKVVNDYFYCTNLCGHFKNCTYIRDFLDKIAATNDEEDDDLF